MGVRPSAVVHRIRAGIYDGICEDGQWYVLRGATPDAARTPPGWDTPQLPRARLPWRTVPGPFRWVTWANRCGLLLGVVGVVALGNGQEEQALQWVAAALGIWGSSCAIEGLLTGIVRGGRGGVAALSEHPVRFALEVMVYVGYVAIALVLLWMRPAS